MSNLHSDACHELCGIPPSTKRYTDLHAVYGRIYFILLEVYQLCGMHCLLVVNVFGFLYSVDSWLLFSLSIQYALELPQNESF